MDDLIVSGWLEATAGMARDGVELTPLLNPPTLFRRA